MPTKTSIAAKKAANARAVLHAYKSFFASEAGKLVLHDLMKTCSFYTPTIGSNPHETYFNEGMRATVLRIIQTSKATERQIDDLTKQMQAQEAEDYID